MKLLCRLLLICTCFITSVFAQGEPLKVGVERFLPPFVMQVSNDKIHGFDIAMMDSICQSINRTCVFTKMRFDELLQAVADKKVDVAVSSITITTERMKEINFTIPYLLSYSRFMTKSSNPEQQFGLNMLQNKTIGIEAGTVFNEQIASMGIQNPTIKTYEKLENLIQALGDDEVDFILVDNPTALYWEANSSSAFKTVGKPYMYGLGMGIAVNRGEVGLLQTLNQALVKYQASNEFKINYSKYIAAF